MDRCKLTKVDIHNHCPMLSRLDLRRKSWLAASMQAPASTGLVACTIVSLDNLECNMNRLDPLSC